MLGLYSLGASPIPITYYALQALHLSNLFAIHIYKGATSAAHLYLFTILISQPCAGHWL